MFQTNDFSFRKTIYPAVLIAFLISFSLSAQQFPSSGNRAGFTENKGQLRNQPNVLFYYDADGMRICIRKDGISYSFFKKNEERAVNKMKPVEFTISQVSMQLQGVEIFPSSVRKIHPRKASSNYFLENCPHGILNVCSYDTLLIKNIYDGIDWKIYLNGKGIKYDFILSPGADPKLIQMQFFGIDSLDLSSNGLQLNLHSPMGEIHEGTLKSFNTITNENIPCAYNLLDNKLGFSVNIPEGTPITIDPPLLWSTYFGGNDIEVTYDMALGPQNSLMIDGVTMSINLPTVDPGVGELYSPTIVGVGTDVFICKYDSARQLVWSTYMGSSGNENAVGGLCIDSAGHIYLVGTASTTDLPLINTGNGMYFQSALNGFWWDLFLATFDANGILFRSTFYGGTHIDSPYASVLDGLGNLYITGVTESIDFPTYDPGGAYFQNLNDGIRDLFILKLDTSGVRKWSTYFGGNGNDEVRDICADLNNNIFLCAGTPSPNIQFPVFNPGGAAYYYPGPNESNMVLMKFNSSDSLVWSTPIGPVVGAIHGDRIKVDRYGQLYVVGACWSNTFPSVDPGGGAWMQSPPSNLSAAVPFIIMFDSSLAMKWSTVIYSALGFSDFTCIDIDTGQNIYLTGNSRAPAQQVLNPGGNSFFQPNNAGLGLDDLIIARFSPSHVRQWLTFFGGSDKEGYGTGGDEYYSVALVDQYQHLLVMNMTKSTDMPLKNRGGSAYMDSTANGNYDVMLMEFGNACEIPNPPAAITSSSPTLCVGDTIALSASVVSGTTLYNWSTTQGISILSPSITQNQSVIVDSSGTVCVSTGNACGSIGSTCLNLNPNYPAGIIPFSDTTVCPQDSVRITLSYVNSAIWTPATFLTDSTGSASVSIPFSNVTYQIEMTDVNGCKSNDSIRIFVNDTCNEIIVDCNFDFYPNPAPGYISFLTACNTDTLKHITLRLYDVLGQIVYENINISNGNNDLNHFELADAMYMYVISDEKKIIRSGKILNVNPR